MKDVSEVFLPEAASAGVPTARGGALLPERVDSFVFLHFFLCSIGLSKILSAIAARCIDLISPVGEIGRFYDWTLPFLFPEKRTEIVAYLFLIVGFSLYFALAYAALRPRWVVLLQDSSRPLRSSRAAFFTYLATTVVLNGLVLCVGDIGRLQESSHLHILFRAAAWAATFLAPFYLAAPATRPLLLAWEDRAAGLWSRYRLAWVGCLVLLYVQLFTIFLPRLQGKLSMINEEFDIPEKTYLSGRLVDNTQYINEHRILNQLRYDVDKGEVPVEQYGLYLKLPKTPLLMSFVASKGIRFSYDNGLGALVVYDAMTPDEKEELRRVAGAGKDESIEKLYYDSHGRVKTSYSPEETEFLKKNYREMIAQTLNRWMIHHHNFVLAPINEYALGRDIRKINIQYGFLNVVVMKFLLEKLGGINYQNYFKVWYSFWPVYYAMLVAFLWLLFRDIRYVLLTSLLAIGLVDRLGHDILLLGPGLNPVRHFFDIPVAACLLLFLRKRRGAFLAAALALSLLSVVNNQQFGLFLLLALVTTVLLADWLETGRVSKGRAAVAAGSLMVGAWLYHSSSLGANPLMSYYLMGFVGIPVNAKFFPALILVLGLAYIALLKAIDLKDDLKFPALFFFIYGQGILLYYVWGGTNPHFLNLSTVLTVACACLLALFIRHTAARRYENLIIAGAASVGFLFLYLPSAVAYYAGARDYESTFQDHPTYQWDLDRAKFRSTMDPKYFEVSVSLIRKYAPENAIYIVSKYDNFLPFLAGRYSEMPFFDVPWYLMTEKESRDCVEKIKTDKPRYLFVDTDISRSLNGDAFHSTVDGYFPREITEAADPRLRIDADNGWKRILDFSTGEYKYVRGDYAPSLQRESEMRVDRLSHLRQVFEAVKDDYIPIEKGVLLTVYALKDAQKRGAHDEYTGTQDGGCPY